MDFQSEDMHLFGNNSISISSRFTERNNPFHAYLAGNQILMKQIPEIENMEIPFEEGSAPDLNSPTPKSNPITSSEKKSQVQLLKGEEDASKCVSPLKKSNDAIDDQKNFLQLIRRKKIMKKFIENLQQAAYIFPQLYSEHFSRIKFEQYLNLRKQTDAIEQPVKVKSTIKFIPLFQPQQPFILFWEFIVFIQVLYVTWWGPFTLVFEGNHTQHSIQEQIILYFGMLDIIMTMNRSIIIQGQILNDRQVILKYYIHNGLLTDIFSICTIGLIDNRVESRNYEFIYLLLVLFLLYFNQKRIRSMLDKTQESFDVQQDALDLVKVLLIILYFAHISACIWAKVSFETERFGFLTWMENYHVRNSQSWIQYNYSLYWATMTMVTVGYGDITPQNPYEMLCSIMIMIISSIIFGYSLNSIGIILKNINDKQQKFRKSQLLINSYMNKNQVNLQLQSKVRNYLKFYIEQDNLQNDEELNTLISKLSASLKEELLYDIQKKPLKSFNFFLKDISIEVQKEIACQLQPLHLTPQDSVYQQQQADENQLYLIVDGEISLIEQKSGTVVRTCGKGECFGQYEFFTGCRREIQARSETFSHIYTLKRENMLSILQNYDEDREKFQNVKDQMIQSNNFESIDLKCYFCKKLNHYFTKCPYLNYQPDVERLIKQEGFLSQIRVRFPRQKQRSGSALNILLLKNDDHEKFLAEIGINEQESASSSSEEDKDQSQQLSKQQSNSVEKMEKVQIKDEYTSTGRIFLSTNNPENKQFSVALEKFCKTRQSKRHHSNHTHQLATTQTPKTQQFELEKENTHVTRRRRSQSIKDVTPQNNKRRSSQDSSSGGNNQNKITISLNNLPKQSNHITSGSSQSLNEPQTDCQKASEDLDSVRLQFLHCDLDKSQQFKFYFPQHNLDQVLINYQRQQKLYKNKTKSESSKYSIYFQARQLSVANRTQKQRQSKIYSPNSKKLIGKSQKKQSLQSPAISLQLPN